MTRPPASSQRADPDILIAALIAVLALAVLGQWLIGNAAALLGRGRLLHANLTEALGALTRLPQHAADPRTAWPAAAARNLPGPVMYWLSTIVVFASLFAAAGVLLRYLSRNRDEPIDKRRRLGVPTQARLARTRDLRPLLTRAPQADRFVLGRYKRYYLSTEAREHVGQRGIAGAVAVFGPSQSGKTHGLLTGVDNWHGPAVISSVKTDLLRTTIERRAGAGDVKVFDPLGITGRPSATWSPLRGARTLNGALAAAQILARSGSEEGPGDRFWRGQAEQLISAMLFTAANTDGHSMRHVVKWVLDLDRPSDDVSGTLAPLVRLLTDNPDPNVGIAARQVQGWLHGQWGTDPRTTSSVYATARNAVWPWADPQLAASADSCDITLDWLLAGTNTLYLCAPLGDETRVGVVFAAVLHDLVRGAFDRYNRTGHLGDPRVLILVDEAANTPLPKLPQWASTVTGAGIQLVTVWQSKAQLDQIYGKDADNVLTNHRTKILYPSGLSDTATVDYFAALAGVEHVRSDLHQPTWRVESDNLDGRSSAATLPLITPNVLRQMQRGDQVILHGELPPAWVKQARRRTP